jgi:large-conductance mechanosensitive channel
LFLLIRGIYLLRSQMVKEEEKPAAAPPRQEVLLEQIRDLLAERRAS